MIDKSLCSVPTPLELSQFLELYKTLHVTRAALRLGVSQPTLTLSLKNLEKKLNTHLFHRTKQGLIATHSAHMFYNQAKNLKECWNEVVSEIDDLNNTIKGSFVLGCHQSLGCYTLPDLYSNLNQQAPDIKLKLIHDSSRKICEKIISFEIDIGYVVNPHKHPDLVLKKIGSDTVKFWKLKTQKQIPKIIFAYENSNQADSLLNSVFRKNEFKNWELVQTASLEIISALTQKGQGVGLIPTRVAQYFCSNIEEYLQDFPQGHDEIYLVYRKELLASRAAKQLVKCAHISLG